MDRNGREETKEKNVNFKARMHIRMMVGKPYFQRASRNEQQPKTLTWIKPKSAADDDDDDAVTNAERG